MWFVRSHMLSKSSNFLKIILATFLLFAFPYEFDNQLYVAINEIQFLIRIVSIDWQCDPAATSPACSMSSFPAPPRHFPSWACPSGGCIWDSSFLSLLLEGQTVSICLPMITHLLWNKGQSLSWASSSPASSGVQLPGKTRLPNMPPLWFFLCTLSLLKFFQKQGAKFASWVVNAVRSLRIVRFVSFLKIPDLHTFILLSKSSRPALASSCSMFPWHFKFTFPSFTCRLPSSPTHHSQFY